jgi:hypothetical protein
MGTLRAIPYIQAPCALRELPCSHLGAGAAPKTEFRKYWAHLQLKFESKCYVDVGLAICKPCGILGLSSIGDLKKIKGINGGKACSKSSGMPSNQREKIGFQKKNSSPRGEGGEGRVRNWEYFLYCRFSFVHVFNGYVASLSRHIN